MQRSNIPEQKVFEEWLSLSTTQAFLHQFLPACRRSLQDQWANGNFSAETLEQTAVANLQAAAQALVYRQLEDIDYQQFSEVLVDE